MNKIWGLVIVLCCCFVSVSFAKETNFNLDVPDSPTLIQNKVTVSVEKNGILTFQAENDFLPRKINMRVIEKVTILSGDYAGWGYAYLEYNAGELKGSIYYVFNDKEGRGMLSGDIVGVAQQLASLEGDMSWKVAALEGTDTQTTVDLIFQSYKPGKITRYWDIWMPVLPGFTLSGAGYSQETTILLLPAPDGNPHHARKFKGGGLEFGTYQYGAGSGTIWSYIDNTELTDPFNQSRYGARDGILAGTSEVVFQNGAGGNSAESWSTLVVD